MLIFFVSLLTVGCQSDGTAVNRNTNVDVQVMAELPSVGPLIELDLYESADNYCESLIATTAPKLGLAPLSQIDRPDEFEFRIWTNLGGLRDPKLLVGRSSGSTNSALFFDLYRCVTSLKSRGKHQADPKSGWNKMIFEMRRRLTNPKGLVRDPQFSLDRDEPMIVLEVLDKGEYGRVLYGRNTTFEDGKRLIQVCTFLALEFALDLDCG